MSKQARSARGQIVNFDLLAIKQQLATKPVSIGVNQRRKFIDEKDGIKTKESYIEPQVKPDQMTTPPVSNSSQPDIQKRAIIPGGN